MPNSYHYGKHLIDNSDIKSVTNSLKGTLSQGPLLSKLEKKISQYFNVKYCLALNSATSALHVAISSLNLKRNTKVFTSNMTFVATTNACLYNNLKPTLIDIDYENFNFDIKQLEKKLKREKKI